MALHDCLIVFTLQEPGVQKILHKANLSKIYCHPDSDAETIFYVCTRSIVEIA